MRLITVLLIGFIAAPAFAQVATPPAQPSDINAPAPLFRVTVVGRTTAAINYRPRSGDTKVDFAGTALMPEARGEPSVWREGLHRDRRAFRQLQPATQFRTRVPDLRAVGDHARGARHEPRRGPGRRRRCARQGDDRAAGVRLDRDGGALLRRHAAERRRRHGKHRPRRHQGQRRNHPGQVRAAEARHVPDEPGRATSR